MTDAATDWTWWLMYAQILFTWWNIVMLSVVFFDVVISNCQHIPLEWIMTVMTLISVILVPFQHLTVISVSVLFTLKSQQLAVSFYYLHHHYINGRFPGELRVVLAIFPSVSFFVQTRKITHWPHPFFICTYIAPIIFNIYSEKIHGDS